MCKILNGYVIIFTIGVDTVLSIDVHLERVRLVVWKDRSNWKNIGRALGVCDGDIKAIHDPNDSECLHKVLSKWIHTGEATISDLLKALAHETVNRNDVVNEIHVLKGKNTYLYKSIIIL